MEAKKNKPHYNVAAGLIWQDGKLLITKRPAGQHLAGFWEFPGGKQKDGETIEHSLKREIKEELGIDVMPGEHIITVQHEYELKLITLHVFHCVCFEGVPAPLEGQELKWVEPVDLMNYGFPPPDLEVIKMIGEKDDIAL